MKLVYPFLMVFLASSAYAQKSQKIDSLITPTDTLVFVKDTVKLTKAELLVRQAGERQMKPVEAIALYKKALAAKSKEQDSSWVGDVHFAIARMYFKLNDGKEGFLNLLKAQSLYGQASNVSCQSAIAREIGELYEKSGDWPEAERYFQLAVKQQESFGLIQDIPYTFLSLANGYYKRKKYADAEKYYSSALNQFELNSEKNRRAEALVQLADLKIKQKNYAQAEHLILKRAMPFFSSVGKPDSKIACFNMLGDIYYLQNRQSEAKWFYIQAYTGYKNQANETGVVRSIVNLAKVKSALGDKQGALKDFKDAEAMAMRRKNLALAADVKVAYARYYNKPGPQAGAASAKPAATKAPALVTSKDSTTVKKSSVAVAVPGKGGQPAIAKKAVKSPTVAAGVKKDSTAKSVSAKKDTLKTATKAVKVAVADSPASVKKVIAKTNKPVISKDSSATKATAVSEKPGVKKEAKTKTISVVAEKTSEDVAPKPVSNDTSVKKGAAKVNKVAIKEETASVIQN